MSLNLARRGAVSLKQIEAIRVFDKWALGIHLSPSRSILVTGMNGEVVVLDASLRELPYLP